jgi:ankyrin repeat protein
VPVASFDIAPPDFYAAARSGDTAAVLAMLARGRFRASAAEHATGKTALMLAAEQGHANVVALLTRGTLAAYIDVEDAEGNTALSLAAASNHQAAVDLLRSRGAGWNGQDAGPVPADTDTALSALVLTSSPPSPAAHIETAPLPGQTPEQHKLAAIFSAIDRGNAAGLRALLLQDSYPVSTIGAVLAMTGRRFVNGAETDDCTPLMAAAWLGRAQMVSDLAHAGASAIQTNAQQMTPLMVAAKNGHANTVRALVMARATIDQAGRDGTATLR